MFYTKKDMAKAYQISPRTVTKTLQACGIATRKTRYSQEEFQRFSQARTLFKAGVGSRDIKTFFSLRKIAGEEVTYVLQEGFSE
jgi:hypothetical protein